MPVIRHSAHRLTALASLTLATTLATATQAATISAAPVASVVAGDTPCVLPDEAERCLQGVDEAIAQGMLHRAEARLAALREHLAQLSASARLRTQLASARLLRWRGDNEAAQALYRAALAADARNVEALVGLALVDLARRRFEAVERQLGTAAGIDASHGELRLAQRWLAEAWRYRLLTPVSVDTINQTRVLTYSAALDIAWSERVEFHLNARARNEQSAVAGAGELVGFSGRVVGVGISVLPEQSTRLRVGAETQAGGNAASYRAWSASAAHNGALGAVEATVRGTQSGAVQSTGWSLQGTARLDRAIRGLESGLRINGERASNDATAKGASVFATLHLGAGAFVGAAVDYRSRSIARQGDEHGVGGRVSARWALNPMLALRIDGSALPAFRERSVAVSLDARWR